MDDEPPTHSSRCYVIFAASAMLGLALLEEWEWALPACIIALLPPAMLGSKWPLGLEKWRREACP